MVVIYFHANSGIHSEVLTDNTAHLLNKALWIDILSPTREEENSIENQLLVKIPTKHEVEEIEPSSRLFVGNNVLFMTATMVAFSESPEAKTDVVMFMLTEKQLITLRYTELHAFELFKTKLLQSKKEKISAAAMLIEIIDSSADRLADILEKVSHKFDDVSKLIFLNHAHKNINYKQILQAIGTNEDLGTKVRESLVSFTRLISFMEQSHGSKLNKEMKLNLAIINKDVDALSDYASFLSSKFNFLLDATLGMINIEQNNTIKILSVAAVIFLPPTLIASIYGMNFVHMPGLNWHAGYPLAIIFMILSAWLPYKFFKKKKWL